MKIPACKNVKEYIYGLFALILFAMPYVSLADGYNQSGIRSEAGTAQAVVPASTNTFEDVLYDISFYVFGFLAALAILVIVIAGIMYITAGGDETRIDNAKKWLLYAIIGLIVSLLAYVIVYAVGQLLGL